MYCIAAHRSRGLVAVAHGEYVSVTKRVVLSESKSLPLFSESFLTYLNRTQRREGGGTAGGWYASRASDVTGNAAQTNPFFDELQPTWQHSRCHILSAWDSVRVGCSYIYSTETHNVAEDGMLQPSRRCGT